jgi:hypothetical protein
MGASLNLREETVVFSAMKMDGVDSLETWLNFLRLGISKNEIFKRVFGLRREAVTGGYRNCVFGASQFVHSMG